MFFVLLRMWKKYFNFFWWVNLTHLSPTPKNVPRKFRESSAKVPQSDPKERSEKVPQSDPKERSEKVPQSDPSTPPPIPTHIAIDQKKNFFCTEN